MLLLSVFVIAWKVLQHSYGLKTCAPWNLLLLAMLLWAGVSTLLAQDHDLAWFGTGYRSDGYRSYLHYAAFFFCALQIKNVTRRRALLWMFGIMISALSAVSVAQAITRESVFRDNLCPLYASTFENINHFAYVLSIGIPLLAGLSISARRDWERWIALVLFGVNLWALIMNQTMGGFVGIIFGIAALLFLFPAKEKQTYRKRILLVVLVFVITCFGTQLVTGQLEKNIKSVFRGISVEEVSNTETGKTSTEIVVSDSAGSGRMRLWRQAARVYLWEHPLFGFGPEGLAERYYEDGFNNDRPHNEYLQHAVFLGIPAAILYIVALVWLFVFCVKRIKVLDINAIVLGIAVISYCVSAFFGNTMYYTSPFFFLSLGLLSGAAWEVNKLEDHASV